MLIRLIHREIALQRETWRMGNEWTYFLLSGELPTKTTKNSLGLTIYSACSSEILTALFHSTSNKLNDAKKRLRLLLIRLVRPMRDSLCYAKSSLGNLRGLITFPVLLPFSCFVSSKQTSQVVLRIFNITHRTKASSTSTLSTKFIANFYRFFCPSPSGGVSLSLAHKKRLLRVNKLWNFALAQSFDSAQRKLFASLRRSSSRISKSLDWTNESGAVAIKMFNTEIALFSHENLSRYRFFQCARPFLLFHFG